MYDCRSVDICSVYPRRLAYKLTLIPVKTERIIVEVLPICALEFYNFHALFWFSHFAFFILFVKFKITDEHIYPSLCAYKTSGEVDS